MSSQGFMKALKCRECSREYPLAATHVCEFDFGPLEVAYDYERITQALGVTAGTDWGYAFNKGYSMAFIGYSASNYFADPTLDNRSQHRAI